MFGLVMSEDRLSLQPRRREIIQVLQSRSNQAISIHIPMVLQLYDDFKNNFNIQHPPYHDLQALKELPDKIRKVLEVDAKVLKVAQVSLIPDYLHLRPSW